MKVCFIAGTLGRGGAELQLFYMLQALQSEGIDTRVLCLTKGEAYEKEIENLGIEVEWIGSSENRILRLMKIITNIRKRPVDVLQSSHFYTNIYAGAAGRILGIPNIGAIRNDLFSEIAANSFFGKWQLKLPKHLIANSEMAVNRALACAVLPRRIYFVRNVVGSTNGSNHNRLNRDNLRVLFVGRLSKQKRPELFVALAVRLLRNFPHLHLSFQVAGDGPLRTRLESLATKAGLSSNVFSFLGVQTEMSSVYRQSDILVLTSEHEGTPNVVLEAMVHGIPVVATRVGGVPEVLSEECGILVDPSDFDALCSATAKLIKDPDLRRRLGRNAQKYVADVHSLPRLRARLIGIYLKLTEGAQLNG